MASHPMFHFLTASENLPFTTALGVMLVLALIEGVFTLVGLGFSQIFDSLHPGSGAPELGGPDASGLQVDHTANPHHGFDLDKATALARFLDWLHIGRVPILIVFIVFLTVFGTVGLAAQSVAANYLGRLVPAVIAAVVVFVVSMPLVRWSAGFLAVILPRDETQSVSDETFIGMQAIVTLGTARRGNPAQAKLKDQYGQTHYVRIEPDADSETFATGADVLIVSREGNVFRVIENPATALLS